jgi:hypothetical protein
MMHVYGLCKEPVCLAEGASKRSRVSIDATCCQKNKRSKSAAGSKMCC